MSWLSSFIDHVTTAPGSSTAQTQSKSAEAVQSNALAQYVQQSANFQPDYAFYRSLVPAQQSAIHGLLALLSPGGQGQAVQAQWQKLLNQGLSVGSQESGAFAGNPALQHAVRLDALNRANTLAGNFANQLGSPTGQLDALKQILQSVNAARPSVQDLNTLGSLVYNRPQSKMPADPLNTLATSALSSLWG